MHVPVRPWLGLYIVSRPEQAEHVLARNQDDYVKPFTYRPLRAVMGDGLVTAEGEVWRRHRRIIQPVFSSRNVASFAAEMDAGARRVMQRWQGSTTIEVASEMGALADAVVGLDVCHEHADRSPARVLECVRVPDCVRSGCPPVREIASCSLFRAEMMGGASQCFRSAGGRRTDRCIENMEVAGCPRSSSVRALAGLHSEEIGRLVFDGGRAHWERRARQLGPLTQSAESLQYLDYQGGSELGAVVTTYPDRTF